MDKMTHIDRPVVTADKLTREVVGLYRSYVEAAAALGTDRNGTLRICLNKAVPQGGPLYARFADEFDRDEVFDGNRNLPIYAVRGDRVRFFYTAEEAAKALRRHPSTIRNCVSRGEGIGLRWGRVKHGAKRTAEILGGGSRGL